MFVDRGLLGPRLMLEYGAAAADAPMGDVNGDGQVNLVDIQALFVAWGPCAGCPEDINGDDAVNLLDVLIVIDNWSSR